MQTIVPAEHDAIVERLRRAGCVFAQDEADVLLGSAATSGQLESMIERRIGGQPLEHVVGWAAFAGLRVAVGEGVFIPRRRSELLVETARTIMKPGDVVLDLCCGSGAVGMAIAAAVDVELLAADIEPTAVCWARANVEPIGGMVYEGDLYDALPSRWHGQIDVIVCNAPYVPDGEIDVLPREARLHEPLVTLSGGADGLDVQRRVIAAADQWLTPGGHVLIETSEWQASQTAELFRASGMDVEIVHDEDVDATVVIGKS
ncbi:MAG: putative protein N(5)-glutamine methyltransferase [Ilumatobacteraceae bacterium]